MHLRRCRAGDKRAVVAVLYDTFQSTWLPEISEEAARAFREEDRPERYFEARGAQFWVAIIEGDVAGFIDWEGDFINALHVRSAYARQGVGASLLEHCEAQIRLAGGRQAALETDTFNTVARAFYTRNGYVETDRYPDTEWNSGLMTLRMVKRFTRPVTDRQTPPISSSV